MTSNLPPGCTSADIDRAMGLYYDVGYEAHDDGATLDDCPYAGMDGDQWMDGWEQAAKEAAEQAKADAIHDRIKEHGR